MAETPLPQAEGAQPARAPAYWPRRFRIAYQVLRFQEHEHAHRNDREEDEAQNPADDFHACSPVNPCSRRTTWLC